MKIGIVGAGPGGLTAAYELLKRGHTVTVFEREKTAGGQMSGFPLGGTILERYYHHLFTSDRFAADQMKELGIGDKLKFLPSTVGFYSEGKIWPFVTPMDLLRFKPLSFLNRLRLGFSVVYLQRVRNWRRFERVTAKEWIIKYMGQQSYDKQWGPLMTSKFGDVTDQVAMAWLWSKFVTRGTSREGGGEKLGYVEGGFQVWADALAAAVKKRGGELRLGAPIEKIAIQGGKVAGIQAGGKLHKFDAVVAAVPTPAFLRLVPDLPEPYASSVRACRYQGAICLVLQMTESLSPVYWLNVADPGYPFVGVIEHTRLAPREWYGGAHVVYFSKYLSAKDPFFAASDDAVYKAYLPHIKRMFPRFDEKTVVKRWCFRDAGAQPVMGLRYSENYPSIETPVGGLYMVNTAQIYPEDRGTNYSALLGLRAAMQINGEDDGAASRAYRHIPNAP